MRHIKRQGLLRVRVYCPRRGVERKFSFNPTDWCPICKASVVWGEES